MTDQEIKQAIQNIIERLNRVEATFAHNKPATSEAIITTIDNALALIDRVQECSQMADRNLERLATELRNGR